MLFICITKAACINCLSDNITIRHNKKDGAVSTLETIFCEFWSVATTVNKIFDKLCNFIDDLHFLCMNSGVNRARSSVKDRIFYRSRALRYRHVATM